MRKHAIIPNKNGVFKKYDELYLDKIKDNTLIEILSLLKVDWKDLLLHQKVNFGRYQVKEQRDIASKITERIKILKVYDKDSILAISMLSEWFEANPALGKSLFADLYNNRAELFLNTIEDKESLYKVMRAKTDLSKIAELAEAIESNPKIFENIDELKLFFKTSNISSLEDLKINSNL